MKLFANERRKKIIELLTIEKRITVKDLAQKLDVSLATMRSDLSAIEQDGIIKRTHGGALINESFFNDTSFIARGKRNTFEKRQIAKSAYQLISHKQCILLDASSTALELARYIKENPIRLTLITTSIQIAFELKDIPEITLIILGGVVTQNSTSIEGTLGIETINSLNIDLLFISTSGFNLSNGLEDFNIYEVALKKELVKKAMKVVALVDSSKIGISSSTLFAKLTDLDVFITEKSISEDIVNTLEFYGIELIIAD